MKPLILIASLCITSPAFATPLGAEASGSFAILLGRIASGQQPRSVTSPASVRAARDAVRYVDWLTAPPTERQISRRETPCRDLPEEPNVHIWEEIEFRGVRSGGDYEYCPSLTRIRRYQESGCGLVAPAILKVEIEFRFEEERSGTESCRR